MQAEVERLSALLVRIKHSTTLDRERLLAELETDGVIPDYEPTASTSSRTQSGPGTMVVKRPASVVRETDDSGSGSDPHSPEDEVAAAMLSELSVAASGQVEHFGATSFLVGRLLRLGFRYSLPESMCSIVPH